MVPETSPSFRLIVGLGNPGSEYARTRHNVGFMVLDRLAASAQITFKLEKKWRTELASHGGVTFCKPQCYMNLSGEPVSEIAHFFKLLPDEILVLLDDIALPLGRLRLRSGGSSGGHNGLQSIIDHQGEKIARLRIGIGAADSGATMTNHVLGRFSTAELPVLEKALDRAAAAVDVAQKQGLDAAMNIYNQQEQQQ